VGARGGAELFGPADSSTALPCATSADITTNKAFLTRACRVIVELDGQNPKMFPCKLEPKNDPFFQIGTEAVGAVLTWTDGLRAGVVDQDVNPSELLPGVSTNSFTWSRWPTSVMMANALPPRPTSSSANA